MNLKRFKIISENKAQNTSETTNILINTEHIVSVKPINVTTESRDVIDGYWIRLSNGKKYRAIQVPKFILDILNEDLPAISLNTESDQEFSIQ
jgi:hypothetical protein